MRVDAVVDYQRFQEMNKGGGSLPLDSVATSVARQIILRSHFPLRSSLLVRTTRALHRFLIRELLLHVAHDLPCWFPVSLSLVLRGCFADDADVWTPHDRNSGSVSSGHSRGIDSHWNPATN